MNEHLPQPQDTTKSVEQPTETLGLEQAANYLRLGRNATRDLWERGELAGTSLNQKHLVFRRAALDAFLAAKEAEQTAERAKAWLRSHGKPDAPAAARRSRRTPKPNLDHYELKT